MTATLIGIAVIALLAMAVIENGSGEDPTPTRVAPEVPTVVVEKPVRDRKIVQTVIVKKRVVVAPTPMPLPPKPPPPLGPVVIEIATAFDITAIGIDSGHPPFYVGVASGDLNNDGVDDLIVGASQADPGGKSRAGQTYVLFGPVLGGAAGAVQRCRHHHQRHRRRRFLGNRRRKRGHQ